MRSVASSAESAALDESGGNCMLDPVHGRRYLLRNHQKLAIADDRVAIIGGANIDDSYMTDRGAEHGATCG